MTYHAPLADMSFALKYGAALLPALEQGFFGDLGMDDVEAVLAEAGRMAGEVIAPLNPVGDRQGTTFKDGAVTTAPGWKEAYRAWCKGGWNGVTAPAEWGGQGLPQVLNAACVEMWNSACMAFAVGPLVGMAAVDAFTVHGSETLKRAYLAKLVTGEWIATMQLTEPQAGSDVGALRTRADRAGDGSYRLKGQKIFITYGEHDLTDNIIHFVLARLPDAPPGTRGISLFLVPKFLLNADGSLGARNDVRAHSVEHKLGIHGSPTCTMIFGDRGGAVGYIVGDENAGMACMFTMMNRARLAVGLQGVGIAERATQQALAYARERRQGRTPGMRPTESAPIIAHPDVKRTLMSMRSLTQAARTICYATAMALDRAERGADKTARQAAHARASLLTISASRWPRSACRCMAAWATSRKPARRSISATRASPRSTKAPTASRRSISSPASCRWPTARWLRRISANCAASWKRSTPPTIRRSAGAACGSRKRSRASRARHAGCCPAFLDRRPACVPRRSR